MKNKKVDGFRLDEGGVTPLRSGNYCYWDAELQQIVMADLSRFCPGVEFTAGGQSGKFSAVFRQNAIGSKELCGTSKSIADKKVRIPKEDVDGFIQALDSFLKKAEDPNVTSGSGAFIREFRVPDPRQMKGAWRVSDGAVRHLIVLWGYREEKDATSAVKPLTETTKNWSDAAQRVDLRSALESVATIGDSRINWGWIGKWILRGILLLLLLAALYALLCSRGCVPGCCKPPASGCSCGPAGEGCSCSEDSGRCECDKKDSPGCNCKKNVPDGCGCGAGPGDCDCNQDSAGGCGCNDSPNSGDGPGGGAGGGGDGSGGGGGGGDGLGGGGGGGDGSGGGGGDGSGGGGGDGDGSGGGGGGAGPGGGGGGGAGPGGGGGGGDGLGGDGGDGLGGGDGGDGLGGGGGDGSGGGDDGEGLGGGDGEGLGGGNGDGLGGGGDGAGPGGVGGEDGSLGDGGDDETSGCDSTGGTVDGNIGGGTGNDSLGDSDGILPNENDAGDVDEVADDVEEVVGEGEVDDVADVDPNDADEAEVDDVEGAGETDDVPEIPVVTIDPPDESGGDVAEPPDEGGGSGPAPPDNPGGDDDDLVDDPDDDIVPKKPDAGPKEPEPPVILNPSFTVLLQGETKNADGTYSAAFGIVSQEEMPEGAAIRWILDGKEQKGVSGRTFAPSVAFGPAEEHRIGAVVAYRAERELKEVPALEYVWQKDLSDTPPESILRHIAIIEQRATDKDRTYCTLALLSEPDDGRVQIRKWSVSQSGKEIPFQKAGGGSVVKNGIRIRFSDIPKSGRIDVVAEAEHEGAVLEPIRGRFEYTPSINAASGTLSGMDADALSELDARVSPSVFICISSDGAFGSAFAVHRRKLVTNAHVVGGLAVGRPVTLYRSGSQTPVRARVAAKDARRDLALLELVAAESDLTPLVLSRAGYPRRRAPVAAIGFPGTAVEARSHVSSDKPIKAWTTGGTVEGTPTVDGMKYVRHDAEVMPGNSGGPLVNLTDGTVAGVNTLVTYDDNQGEAVNRKSLAVPTQTLREFLERNGVR